MVKRSRIGWIEVVRYEGIVVVSIGAPQVVWLAVIGFVGIVSPTATVLLTG